jgi:hypothetical protein
MSYDWDEAKRQANLKKHGVDFARAEGFDWDSALVIEDRRQDYGEPRLSALGYIGKRLHVLIFTPRGRVVRLIGLRKANAREVRQYEQDSTQA